MRLIVSIFIVTLMLCSIAFAYESIDAFDQKILYTPPDSSVWKLIQYSLPSAEAKGILMFKRTPLRDNQNRSVEPIMAIVVEYLHDPIDVVEYSAGIIGTKPFQIKQELLGGYPDYSSAKQSVVFKGEYVSNSVKHTVYLGYIISEHIGIEIITDATEDVFSKTKSDMTALIKSVVID